MTTTPNMGLVLPTDHDSNDIWDVILDTVFGSIDSHDHSTGKGVKIPAAALNINADVSWSDSLGASHSITDLVSVDFKPSPAAAVTGFAGAFFISDGSGGLSANELYFRTIAGTNVKFTAGAALNVAAFTGGFGGDYAAAGALVVFDDATDSYWFQQQVGSAVRQYARMRSADVDLYEFKANPAAGVPTNRVRLASPAGLAGSYAVTWPAAVPSAKSPVTMDSAGTLTVSGSGTRVYSIHNAVFFAPAALTVGGGVLRSLDMSTSTAVFAAPVITNAGETLTSWSLFMSKASAAGTISASLWEISTTGGAATQIGATQTNGAVSPGNITLGQSGLAQVISATKNYAIMFNGGGTGGDFAYGWSAACI